MKPKSVYNIYSWLTHKRWSFGYPHRVSSKYDAIQMAPTRLNDSEGCMTQWMSPIFLQTNGFFSCIHHLIKNCPLLYSE